MYYNDFVDFITEDNFEKVTKDGEPRPSPTRVVLTKLGSAFLLASVVLVAVPMVPSERLAEDDFLSKNSFFAIIIYMVAATSAARFKYYLAWRLGDTIANASGLGFTGFRDDGTADWELTSNMNIFSFEVIIYCDVDVATNTSCVDGAQL